MLLGVEKAPLMLDLKPLGVLIAAAQKGEEGAQELEALERRGGIALGFGGTGPGKGEIGGEANGELLGERPGGGMGELGGGGNHALEGLDAGRVQRADGVVDIVIFHIFGSIRSYF